MLHLHRYEDYPDDWPTCRCGRRQYESRRWRLRHWWYELWRHQGPLPF